MTPEQFEELLRIVQSLQAEQVRHAQALREAVVVLEGLYNAAEPKDESTQETG
jgi:hypothetical protein